VYLSERFNVFADPLYVLDLVGILDAIVYLDNIVDEKSPRAATSSPRGQSSERGAPSAHRMSETAG
jgi:hypothetical protein